jgi:hypothetical protein
MVFEFVEDNLESLIERNVKAQTRIKESDIKVFFITILEIHVSTFKWSRLDS